MPDLRRSIEEADEAELAARDAGAGLSGRLRFSSGVTFGRLHIIPRLPLFLTAHPELTVEAILDDRVVDLIEEGIDVGFPMGMLADSTMVARKIGQSRRLVLGTPSYFEKAGEPSRPAELADHQAVIYAQDTGGATWSFRNGTAEETVTLKGSVRTTAAEGLREAVFAGLGLCVASEWMFQPDLDNGRVKQVFPAWTLPSPNGHKITMLEEAEISQPRLVTRPRALPLARVRSRGAKPRSGEAAKNSARVPPRPVLRVHSSTETTTTAGRPFLVIACGPCLSARSMTSLSRALACATDQATAFSDMSCLDSF